MSVAYFDPLSRAWQRMKGVLLRPFNLATWLVLAFSAWLAGLLDGGGGGGAAQWKGDLDRGPMEALRDLGDSWEHVLDQFLWAPLVVIGLLVLLALLLLALWVSSRAKLVYLDNVIHSRARIVEPWRRLGRLGDSLFLWRLCFGLVLLALLGGLLAAGIAPAAGLFSGPLRPWSIALIVVLATAFVLIMIAAVYVSLFTESFIVPIMYRFNLSTTAAWRHFLPWLTTYAPAFVLYGLFVLVLFIVVGGVILTLGLMTCCIGLVLVSLPYVGTVILLPLKVTYRLFSLEFLAQLDPGLDAFAVTRDAS